MLLQDFKNEQGDWVRSSSVRGVQTLTVSGAKWKDLVKRCKPGGYYQTTYPTYAGACNDFKNFQIFVEWSIRQVGYNCEWELDKDILFKRNKSYSEDTCVFVPRELNIFFAKSTGRRGTLPIGVHWCTDRLKYRASCGNGAGTSEFLGYFDAPTAPFWPTSVRRRVF
jgi:hypothetical protein